MLLKGEEIAGNNLAFGENKLGSIKSQYGRSSLCN